MNKTITISVDVLKKMPVNTGILSATTEDEVVYNDCMLSYAYKESVPVVSWTPSHIQAAVLEFIGKDVFTSKDVRAKLLKLDAKYMQESKIVDDKLIIRTLKSAAIFGLSDYSVRMSKTTGSITFKLTGTPPASLHFHLLFRSPEEVEAARLAALTKRIDTAMGNKDECTIVEAAVAKNHSAEAVRTPSAKVIKVA
jgi:hypothetical protein